MGITVAAVLQWVGLLEKLRQGGTPALTAVKNALAAHGYAADTAIIDELIIDADARAARARAEAGGAEQGPGDTENLGGK
jgi:hypothetical protein